MADDAAQLAAGLDPSLPCHSTTKQFDASHPVPDCSCMLTHEQHAHGVVGYFIIEAAV